MCKIWIFFIYTNYPAHACIYSIHESLRGRASHRELLQIFWTVVADEVVVQWRYDGNRTAGNWFHFFLVQVSDSGNEWFSHGVCILVFPGRLRFISISLFWKRKLNILILKPVLVVNSNWIRSCWTPYIGLLTLELFLVDINGFDTAYHY